MWGGWRSGNKWPVKQIMKLEIPETCRIVTQDNTNKFSYKLHIISLLAGRYELTKLTSLPM